MKGSEEKSLALPTGGALTNLQAVGIQPGPARQGHGLETAQRHTHGGSVAISADTRFVVTWTWGQVAVWEIATGRCVREGHSRQVNLVAFSGDGRYLATGSADHTAELSETATGRLLKVCQGHTGSVESVAFHPSGSTLITGSQDGTMRFWATAEYGPGLLAILYSLADGFLWTTPPDEVAPQGWLWTDRPEFVNVYRCRLEDGREVDAEPLPDGDPDREAYLRRFNDKDKVLGRLYDYAGYRDEIDRLARRVRGNALDSHQRLLRHLLPGGRP